jgi:hypothetical protein
MHSDPQIINASSFCGQESHTGTWRDLLYRFREGGGCGGHERRWLEAVGGRHAPHAAHPVRHRVLVKHPALLQLYHVHLPHPITNNYDRQTLVLADASVADPGCLSRIPDPKTATKERGVKKLVVIPFYVATNFTKLEIIKALKC